MTVTFMECLVCARHLVKHVTMDISFNPLKNPREYIIGIFSIFQMRKQLREVKIFKESDQ